MMNDDLISRKQAFDMIMGQPPEVHYPSWYADQIMGLPPAQKAEDLDRLIKALEQEHKKLRKMQSATDKNVGSKDTIYRQAAIDAVERAKTVRSEDGEIYCAKVNAQMNIHLLPSAQAQLGTNLAEVSTDTISRQAAIDALKNDMASLDHIIKGMSANDVRLDAYVSQRNQVNYDIYTINNLPPAQPEPCEDAVSRADILSMIDDMADDVRDGFGFAYEQWKEQAEELPPVTPKQPEQRTGKWIVPSQVPDMVKGYWMTCSVCKKGVFGDGKFCRECGAKMER